MPDKAITCRVFEFETIPYSECLRLQLAARQKIVAEGGPDSLFLVEHPIVITLGRSARKENILDPCRVREEGIPVIDAGRGGDVTMHLPGQLVAYPVFDLNRHGRDLRRFIYFLEETQIRFLSAYGIQAGRRDGFPGVWVKRKKIGFVGIAVSRWISCHGISLNIGCDLSQFEMIRPCGIDRLQVTSLEQLTNVILPMGKAREHLLACFVEVFRLSCVKLPKNRLEQIRL